MSTNVEITKSNLVAKFAKNGREEVRVSVDIYKGRPLINIRVWYMHMETGEFCPGKQGITLPIDKFDALQVAVTQLGIELKGNKT